MGNVYSYFVEAIPFARQSMTTCIHSFDGVHLTIWMIFYMHHGDIFIRQGLLLFKCSKWMATTNGSVANSIEFVVMSIGWSTPIIINLDFNYNMPIAAVSSGVSLVLSSILAVIVFSTMQIYRPWLASAQLNTILGGYLGSWLFILTLTVSSFDTFNTRFV